MSTRKWTNLEYGTFHKANDLDSSNVNVVRRKRKRKGRGYEVGTGLHRERLQRHNQMSYMHLDGILTLKLIYIHIFIH